MADRIPSKKYEGVYFRESKKRMHNGKPDRSYIVGWYQDGVKKYETIGWASRGVTEEYANRKRIALLNSINLGENPDSLTGKKGITLDKAIAAYMDNGDAEGKHTGPERNRYEQHIEPFFKGMRINSITPEILDKFKAKLLETLAPSTAKKVFTLMRSAINFAIRRKMHTRINPISKQADFAMPREDNEAERFLTPKEVNDLLHELEKRSEKLWHMAFVSLHTGMRPTELFKMKARDIDAKNMVAMITAKGGDRQSVLLTPEVLKILQHNTKGKDVYIFPKIGGGQMKETPDTFSRAVDALGLNDSGEFTTNGKGEKVPVKITDARYRVRFHTLRHTFASWLAQSGEVGIYELMQLLRHERIEMTMRYAHLIPDKQREKLSVIGRVMAGQNQQSAPEKNP